jgi:Rrf2 family transcriptional regulator, iron-sulfur cluster assembly transcription factor
MYLGMQQDRRHMQAKDIALALGIPRHFTGKILKRLAKEKILLSIKGPSGGFTTNEHSLNTPLITVFIITEGRSTLEACALKFGKCDSENPCPLHAEIEKLRRDLTQVLAGKTIESLMTGDDEQLLKSITTLPEKMPEEINL